MDLDTFLTTLYVLIDDWYKAEMAEAMQRHPGPEVQMTDSEVLTVAIAGQWRVGVPWQSERGVVRYMQTHGRHWFPTMLKKSQFNQRVRDHWAAFVRLQQYVADWLAEPADIYEVVDCVPLPACSLAQSKRQGTGHWLWWSTKGYGGTRNNWYWGDQALVSVSAQGMVTGWVVASAQTDDRWLLQMLVSQRQRQGQLVGPPPRQASRTSSPPTHIGPLLACGSTVSTRVYVGDKGFGGQRWRDHWAQHYQVQVVTAPKKHTKGVVWSRPWQRWLNSLRQVVETTFAILTNVFSWQRLRAHSRWGQYTRVAIAAAAYNLGIYLNRLVGRPDRAHETLIC